MKHRTDPEFAQNLLTVISKGLTLDPFIITFFLLFTVSTAKSEVMNLANKAGPKQKIFRKGVFELIVIPFHRDFL